MTDTLKNTIIWRDFAGFVWQTETVSDEAGAERSSDVLVTAADPAAPFPVPMLTQHLDHSTLVLTDDVGVAVRISSNGLPGIKSAQVIFRDAEQNVWLAEEFKDSAGLSWTANSLIAAANV